MRMKKKLNLNIQAQQIQIDFSLFWIQWIFYSQWVYTAWSISRFPYILDCTYKSWDDRHPKMLFLKSKKKKDKHSMVNLGIKHGDERDACRLYAECWLTGRHCPFLARASHLSPPLLHSVMGADGCRGNADRHRCEPTRECTNNTAPSSVRRHTVEHFYNEWTNSYDTLTLQSWHILITVKVKEWQTDIMFTERKKPGQLVLWQQGCEWRRAWSILQSVHCSQTELWCNKLV